MPSSCAFDVVWPIRHDTSERRPQNTTREGSEGHEIRCAYTSGSPIVPFAASEHLTTESNIHVFTGSLHPVNGDGLVVLGCLREPGPHYRLPIGEVTLDVITPSGFTDSSSSRILVGTPLSFFAPEPQNR